MSTESEELSPRVRAFLRNFASAQKAITYQELALALELQPPNTIHRVTVALEQSMKEDAAANRPFIAALVISRRRQGLPAPGFFHCAKSLGRFAGNEAGLDAEVFYAQEFRAALAYWQVAPSAHS